MNDGSTKSKARMVELEFAEAHKVAAKRRRFFRLIFVIGLCAPIGTLVNSIFLGSTLTTLLLFMVWLASAGIYTFGRVFPSSFSTDADVRWHINPWRDALEHLVGEDRHIPAIVLLASMPVCLVIVKLIHFAHDTPGIGPAQ